MLKLGNRISVFFISQFPKEPVSFWETGPLLCGDVKMNCKPSGDFVNPLHVLGSNDGAG